MGGGENRKRSMPIPLLSASLIAIHFHGNDTDFVCIFLSHLWGEWKFSPEFPNWP